MDIGCRQIAEFSLLISILTLIHVYSRLNKSNFNSKQIFRKISKSKDFLLTKLKINFKINL